MIFAADVIRGENKWKRTWRNGEMYLIEDELKSALARQACVFKSGKQMKNRATKSRGQRGAGI